MPVCTDYQLSPIVGFLNSPKQYDLPPDRPRWQHFEAIVRMVQLGVSGSAYRDAVDALNDDGGAAIGEAAADDVKNLDSDAVRWAYSTFTMVCQKYVHGDPPHVRELLPEMIGLPWHALTVARGSKMTLTYDALVINNWILKDPSKPADLDNLDVALVVSGTAAEKGFIVVHMAMEAAGKDWPPRMLSLHEEMLVTLNATGTLRRFLTDSIPRLRNITMLLGKMWVMCRDDDYWNVVRVTLMGYPEAAFPNGLRVKNHSEILAERKGGSGAQSPLMHAIDTFFGVEHNDSDAAPEARPLSDVQSDAEFVKNAIAAQQRLPAHARKFFDEQKHFMSEVHRKYFFHHLEVRPSLRDLVARFGDAECLKLYNECIDLIVKMRKVHQLLAHKYVAEKAVVAERDAARSAAVIPGGGIHVSGASGGAGGSNFVSLLSQAIAETGSARLPTIA